MKLQSLFVTLLCVNITLVSAGGSSHLDKYELARYIAKKYSVKNAQNEKRSSRKSIMPVNLHETKKNSFIV